MQLIALKKIKYIPFYKNAFFLTQTVYESAIFLFQRKKSIWLQLFSVLHSLRK